MKRFLALILILSLLTGCATSDGIRMEFSKSFDINYDKMPEEEQKKVDKMAKALDNSIDYINNLETRDKGNKIIIKNQQVLIDSNDWKKKERVEKGNGWKIGLAVGCGAGVGALLVYLGVKASK